MNAEHVSFDILLRSAGAGREASVASVESFKPTPDDIAKCHRWLLSKGFSAHMTEFGLTCSAPKVLFEETFSVSLQPSGGEAGQPAFVMSGPVIPPDEIAELVDQVTITPLPILF